MAKRSNSDFIDIPALVRQYVKRWYLFVISVVLCAGIAFFYTKVRQTEYAVRANVLITPERDSSPLAGGLGDLGSLFGSQGDVDDEIFVISSHSLYCNVVRQLGTNIQETVRKNLFVKKFAYPEQPVTVTPQAGMLDTLQTSIIFRLKVNDRGLASIKGTMERTTVLKEKDLKLPFTVNTPIGEFTFAPSQYYPKGESLDVSIKVMGYDEAAEELDTNISTEMASKRSNVIQLGINTPNTVYGKDVLNAIIKQYNERGILEQNKQNELTAKFIDGRLGIIADELNTVETDLQKYKQQKGIVNVNVEAEYQTRKKGELETELLTAETEVEIINITLQFLREPVNAYSLIPTTLDNEAISKAIATYNEKVLERTALANSARADNKALKLLSEQIDEMRANIIQTISRALATAEVRLRDIKKEMNATESSLAGIPEQEREFVNLLRQQKVKHELFIFLLQRREETAMMLANAFPKGQIVDRAFTLSEPLGMKKRVVWLLGILIGLMLPPVYLYLRKLVHNRFETRSDVERMTDVPILGEMCIDDSGRRLVVSSDDTTATAELFRLMRSNLLFVLNDPRDKVVLMTSTSSGEGKSFISINLAASLALLGKKVLLIGMDIRNPRLAEYLGIHPRFGLTQYLSSASISIEQTVTHLSDVPGLDVICAGPVPPNPAELLVSDKVDELFRELRTQYDYIIVDTAPIGLVSDTFTLDRIADAAIYVCRANYTSMSDLELINDIYEQHRLKKVSLVINGTASKKTYGYGKKKAHS